MLLLWLQGLMEQCVFPTIMTSSVSGSTPFCHDMMPGFSALVIHAFLAHQLIFLFGEAFAEDARVRLRDLLLELTAPSVTAGRNKIILRKLFVAVRSCTSISTCQDPLYTLIPGLRVTAIVNSNYSCLQPSWQSRAF
jgi:hypothetical protein